MAPPRPAEGSTAAVAPATAPQIDPACMALRRQHFADRIDFHAPGLKRYATSEYRGHDCAEFVAISLTGSACALSCAHCETRVLEGMDDLPASGMSLFDRCAALEAQGARGVLISGGNDLRGRVPLRPHLADLRRVREELGMLVRVHPGLPDDETCEALGAIGIDGAMVDVIGDVDTIREVYHLDSQPADFEAMLARLARHGVPAVPHIVLGLHFGKMRGEYHALEMVARHARRLLVLVVLMPLSGTAMAGVTPPPIEQIASFFSLARLTLPDTPVMLGCARPLGSLKAEIDRAAVDAGLNGIAYPAEGIVGYAQARGLQPVFTNACCGVTW
ncbi:MAG: radical SAM protein [Planctomycetes bacterium]|nr:radical SAM protein [Planctomycetota bacterium]